MSTVEFDQLGSALTGRVSPPAGITAANSRPRWPRHGFMGRALQFGAGASIAMLLLVVVLVLRFAHVLWAMPGVMLG